MTAPNFYTIAASATVVPVVASDGTLNTSALTAANKVVVGILDPTMTQKVYNPVAEGNPVVGGTDTAATWMPTVASVSAAGVADNYWLSVPGQTAVTSPNRVGQVTLNLKAAAANTIEAPSVMSLKLSPQALVLLAANTGSF